PFDRVTHHQPEQTTRGSRHTNHEIAIVERTARDDTAITLRRRPSTRASHHAHNALPRRGELVADAAESTPSATAHRLGRGPTGPPNLARDYVPPTNDRTRDVEGGGNQGCARPNHRSTYRHSHGDGRRRGRVLSRRIGMWREVV